MWLGQNKRTTTHTLTVSLWWFFFGPSILLLLDSVVVVTGVAHEVEVHLMRYLKSTSPHEVEVHLMRFVRCEVWGTSQISMRCEVWGTSQISKRWLFLYHLFLTVSVTLSFVRLTIGHLIVYFLLVSRQYLPSAIKIKLTETDWPCLKETHLH